MTTDIAHHRPRHAARGLPPAARARPLRRSCSSRSTRAASAATRSWAAARASSRSKRPSSSTSRLSGTSATTTSRSSSRRCRCPDAGPDVPGEPLRRRRHVPPLRPRDRHRGRTARRPGDGRRDTRRGRGRRRAGGHGRRGLARRRTALSTSAASRACQEHIRRGDAFQVVLSQRAEAPDFRDAAVPRAARRESVGSRTCSCSRASGAHARSAGRRARDHAARARRLVHGPYRAVSRPSSPGRPRSTARRCRSRGRSGARTSATTKRLSGSAGAGVRERDGRLELRDVVEATYPRPAPRALGLSERDEPVAAADERVAPEPPLVDGLEQEGCGAARAQVEVGRERREARRVWSGNENEPFGS